MVILYMYFIIFTQQQYELNNKLGLYLEPVNHNYDLSTNGNCHLLPTGTLMSTPT